MTFAADLPSFSPSKQIQPAKQHPGSSVFFESESQEFIFGATILVLFGAYPKLYFSSSPIVQLQIGNGRTIPTAANRLRKIGEGKRVCDFVASLAAQIPELASSSSANNSEQKGYMRVSRPHEPRDPAVSNVLTALRRPRKPLILKRGGKPSARMIEFRVSAADGR